MEKGKVSVWTWTWRRIFDYCKLKKGSITLIFWEEKNFVYFDIVYFERMENFFLEISLYKFPPFLKIIFEQNFVFTNFLINISWQKFENSSLLLQITVFHIYLLILFRQRIEASINSLKMQHY